MHFSEAQYQPRGMPIDQLSESGGRTSLGGARAARSASHAPDGVAAAASVGHRAGSRDTND